MNQSQELFDKAQKLIPGGVNSVRAFRSVGGSPFFTRQRGYLTTADDQVLIDYV